MLTNREVRRLFQVGVACSMFFAVSLLAQDRAVLTWAGRVDKEVQITIRDTVITTSIKGGQPVTVAYSASWDRVPRRDGFVRVELSDGRGDVDVIQQPNASNEFAAVIRIRDHSKGRDNYALSAFWNPTRGEDRYSSAAAAARGATTPRGPNTMHWSGNVDREMRIEWRGFNVQSRNRRGAAARQVHSQVSSALPETDAKLELKVLEGRGDVGIVQQPSSSNGWTAIFRVRDPQTGLGHYDFDVTWR